MTNKLATVLATWFGCGYAPAAPGTAGSLAALVIAALCAEGQSVLRNAWHVDRGYEDMAGKLASVGAQIEKASIDSDGSGTERTYE